MDIYNLKRRSQNLLNIKQVNLLMTWNLMEGDSKCYCPKDGESEVG